MPEIRSTVGGADRKILLLLIAQLQAALHRRDGAESVAILRLMLAVDPIFTNELMDALLDAGLQRALDSLPEADPEGRP
jgi:hypothetical protein